MWNHTKIADYLFIKKTYKQIKYDFIKFYLKVTYEYPNYL